MTTNFIDLQPYKSELMINHERMYQVADANEYKGKKGGNCNVTQCQKWGASSWNGGMDAFYCESCASDIKAHSNGLFEVDVLPDGTHDYDMCAWIMKLDADRKRKRELWAPVIQVVRGKKIGRNETCPCGSNKKYKKCCGA